MSSTDKEMIQKEYPAHALKQSYPVAQIDPNKIYDIVKKWKDPKLKANDLESISIDHLKPEELHVLNCILSALAKKGSSTFQNKLQKKVSDALNSKNYSQKFGLTMEQVRSLAWALKGETEAEHKERMAEILNSDALTVEQKNAFQSVAESGKPWHYLYYFRDEAGNYRPSSW